MTILVTGGSGQLAGELEAAADGRAMRRVGRPEFDFDHPASIEATLAGAAPSLVINAAAYTAVDKAEQDAAAALRANRDGPEIMARYCARAGIPFIHVSTDYVFDGLKGAPYIETDAPSPTGVYGSSKLAGETAVLAACRQAVILRTSWVYAATGKNFVLTMLNAATKVQRLRVVADQKGCPTAAADLAAAIMAIAARLEGGWSDDYGGVFHAAGGGETTWHGLAVATFEAAAPHGLVAPSVDAITTADWPTPARRPPDSRLDCSKLRSVFDVELPHWRKTLGKVVDHVFLGQRNIRSGPTVVPV